MDNPVEAAANELKKWIEQLKKIMAMLEAQEKAKIAEQKAIGDKALAAHKEMVAKTKHDELMKELKGIKEGIKNTPDTPGKDEALDQANDLEARLENDMEVNLEDPDEVTNALDDPDGTDVEIELDVEDDKSNYVDAPDTVKNVAGDPDDLEVELDVEDDKSNYVDAGKLDGLKADGPDLGSVDVSELNEIVGPKVEKAMSTGDAINWKKSDKGWVNSQGQSAGDLLKGPSVAAPGLNVGIGG